MKELLARGKYLMGALILSFVSFMVYFVQKVAQLSLFSIGCGLLVLVVYSMMLYPITGYSITLVDCIGIYLSLRFVFALYLEVSLGSQAIAASKYEEYLQLFVGLVMDVCFTNPTFVLLQWLVPIGMGLMQGGF